MDFITDIKGPLLERFSPEQVNDIVDIITLALVRYDVEPKSTALVEYKADDFELVQKFFVAKATEGLTQNTLRYYKTVLQKALKTFNKHIKDITTNDVRAYIVSMKFRGNTERTQNNERRVLSSFFKFLLAEGEITTNPMLRINKIKEPKKLIRLSSSFCIQRGAVCRRCAHLTSRTWTSRKGRLSCLARERNTERHTSPRGAHSTSKSISTGAKTICPTYSLTFHLNG